MRDLQAISDVITLGIKAAMAPVLERLAVAEAKAARVTETEQALALLRDRVTAWEAKADAPLSVPVVAEPVDLTPLRERIASLEAQALRVPVIELSLAEMRDKLVALETKAAQPVPVPDIELPDLTPLEKRLDAIEARPAPVNDIPPNLTARLNSLEQRAEGVVLSAEYEKGLSGIRERLAVVETKAPIPGPPGKDGANGHDGKDGKDGLNGKDGADGFAFEDLAVEQKDDCSFTIKAIKGDRIKDIGTAKFDVERYRGVYHEGRTYDRGECVTWGGSEWHCNETTNTKPGDGSKSWTLKVKRGRDGKDGKDAPSLPVVSLK